MVLVDYFKVVLKPEEEVDTKLWRMSKDKDGSLAILDKGTGALEITRLWAPPLPINYVEVDVTI